MMNVSEYSDDIKRSVKEVLEQCKKLGIDVKTEDDLLDDDAITILDNYFEEHEETELDDELEDKATQIATEEIHTVDDTVKQQKLKKNKEISKKVRKEYASKRKEMYKHKEKLQSNTPVVTESVVVYKDGMTIGDLAMELGVSGTEVIKKLMQLGVMTTINQPIAYDTATIIVEDYKKELKKEEQTDVVNFEAFEIEDDAKDLEERPPVVTIMGHVDHGKTTLLDSIRNSDVVGGEAGGITQHIGAYQVSCKDKLITFIDTPGHAAFTEMRARGASITDIVIIIVAADDGVMPQTKEAIDHAKAAEVPIIVAINKMDKPDANPERVMQELTEYGLTPEEWGGDTIMTKISAATGDGIDDLLENILLISEMQELKANKSRYATGTVVEAKLDKHVGPVVTLLIQNGTLRLGDPIVIGTTYGKVRTLKNSKGEQIVEALPSTPVEVTGLNDTPSAGDKFMAFETEKEARAIGEERRTQARLRENATTAAMSLEDLFSKIQEGAKEINVVLKTDVQGSCEAVKNSLEKIDVEGVKVKVIRGGVGTITESDVLLANASNAVIIGFNVRPTAKVTSMAKEENVDIRLYNIIYKVVEEMEAAMKGMLDPEYEEKILGQAEVRQLFKFSKVGTIAGSYVTDGMFKKDSKVRVIRDGVVIYDGNVFSVQRGKDQAREVKKGFECGITIDGFNDIKVGDILEGYEIVEKERM